ncbi:sugar O-acetyltransferase [Shewanella piezotolerans]|nr:sugar O-acetyltransferase [Shewanella piezotolerans]
MTEYERMLTGAVFDGGDAEISAVRDKAFILTKQINNSASFTESQQRVTQLLGSIAAGSLVSAPFNCEFGQQIHIGRDSFINMGVTMLDGAMITIGNNVMIGPNSQLYTASHSIDYLSRRRWETFCKPITIKDDVWIGGNVVINQGVTIGERSVVAAGSVVNHDVPADTLVGGTPARILKKLAAS